MKNNSKGRAIDKKEYLRESTHLTRPPRMKGVVHKAGVKPKKKGK